MMSPPLVAPIKESHEEAFVTLVTSDSYVPGALVLGSSLRKVGSNKRRIALVTSLCSSSLKALETEWEIRQVPLLLSDDEKGLLLLGRPELSVTLSKISVWNQIDLRKIIFMDSDMLVLQNIDSLFEECEELSAAPDSGWPDSFNSGLFVLRPSQETFSSLKERMSTFGSWDGADQGLLNSHFPNWNRISFLYNCTSNTHYSYLPAFERFRKEVKVYHFIGRDGKPWKRKGEYLRGNIDGSGDPFLKIWWDIHESIIHEHRENDSYFMSLYQSMSNFSLSSGNLGNVSVGICSVGGGGSNTIQHHHQHEPMFRDKKNDSPPIKALSDYRIKWSDDIESFYQRRKNERK